MLAWILSWIPIRFLEASIMARKEVARCEVTLWRDALRYGPDIDADTAAYFHHDHDTALVLKPYNEPKVTDERFH